MIEHLVHTNYFKNVKLHLKYLFIKVVCVTYVHSKIISILTCVHIFEIKISIHGFNGTYLYILMDQKIKMFFQIFNFEWSERSIVLNDVYIFSGNTVLGSEQCPKCISIKLQKPISSNHHNYTKDQRNKGRTSHITYFLLTILFVCSSFYNVCFNFF